MIHGIDAANYFRRGAEFGIAAGDWKVEMPALRDRKRKMVDERLRTTAVGAAVDRGQLRRQPCTSRTSPTKAITTSVPATTSPVLTAKRLAVWCLFACLPTPNWPASA